MVHLVAPKAASVAAAQHPIAQVPLAAPSPEGDGMPSVLRLPARAVALVADERAPEVRTSVVVAAARSELFALATNASQWPRWHPATVSVSETPDRPLARGESVVESIRTAGRSFAARWVVVECEAPRRWVIATDTPRGCAWIEYLLTPDPAGTRFTRRLRWRSRGAFWAWCDRWLTRWVLARQSRQALARLSSLFPARDRAP